MKKIISTFLLCSILIGSVSCTASIVPTTEPIETIDPTQSVSLPTAISRPSLDEIQPAFSLKERQSLISDPADYSPVAEQMNAFGFDLFHLLSTQQDGNLFFSPYSISLALSMTLAGAAGNTEQEMAQVLHYDLPQNQIHTQINGLDQSLYIIPEWLKDQESSFQLNVANALWGQSDYAFKTTFLDLLAESYGAGMQLVDFKTANEKARIMINDWVEDQTEEKIKDLIPQGALNELTRLVLTNAIYFNAAWQDEFVKDLTKPADFFVNEKTIVSVPMMEIHNNYRFIKSNDVQMVEIPYLNSRYSMVLLMPLSSDLSEFGQGLDPDSLTQAFEDFQNGQLILKMPKFKFDSSFSVSSALQDLGMISPFSPTDADFSGMYEPGSDPLFISNVIHKAFVAVDEEGTEAAAATAVIMEATSAMPEEEPVLMVFDHPFIFLIRDSESGLILFMGNMINPE